MNIADRVRDPLRARLRRRGARPRSRSTEIDAGQPRGRAARGRATRSSRSTASRPPTVGRSRTAPSAFAKQIDTHSCAGEPPTAARATTPATVVVERDGQRRYRSRSRPYYDAERAAHADRLRRSGRRRVQPTVEPDRPPRRRSALGRLHVAGHSADGHGLRRIFEPEQREQISGVVGGQLRSATRRSTSAPRGADAARGDQPLARPSSTCSRSCRSTAATSSGAWSRRSAGSRVPFSVIERAGAVGFVLVLILFFIGLSNDIEPPRRDEGFNVALSASPGEPLSDGVGDGVEVGLEPVVAGNQHDLRLGPGAGVPNGSFSPWTTRTGDLTASSSSWRDFSGLPGGWTGRRGRAPRWRRYSAAVRQATRAPADAAAGDQRQALQLAVAQGLSDRATTPRRACRRAGCDFLPATL